MSLLWKIDDCAVYFDRMRVRGWAYDADAAVVGAEAVFAEPACVVALKSYGLASPDVAQAVDPRATHCRFEQWLEVPEAALGKDFILRFTYRDGAVVVGGS